MIFIPLNDTTEARYGEIARIMLETGNWVTPMQAYGEPFWAKPPLSMWLQAFSMKCFGVNAFAARLPSLFLSIEVLFLVFHLAVKQCSRAHALLAVVVLAGCPFFFINAGAVMTDPALLFCFTLSMVSFWLSVIKQERLWGYLFFVGLGLGLLAKGPLIGVLVGFPLLIWILKENAWRVTWKNLPWFTGICLMLLLALPWYVLAEIRTPGFLNYFVVGEHISRFLKPAWQGDKYGFAHQAPIGMIWVYASIGVLPWLIYGVIGFIKSRKRLNFQSTDHDGWISYLILFMLSPLIFFTFARNIIYPYTFPMLPAFALLFTTILVNVFPEEDRKNVDWVAGIIGVIFLVVTSIFVFKPALVTKSQNQTIALWQAQPLSSVDNLIYWMKETDFSARFYSHGRVDATHDLLQLKKLLNKPSSHYVVISERDLPEISDGLLQELHVVGRVHVLKNTLVLFRAK